MEKTSDIIVKPLEPGLLNDFLNFFDNTAFVDNKDWDGCYCVFYHHEKDVKDWMARTKSDNRSMAISLINKGQLKGFLAFHTNQPIAWCNVNNKEAFSLNKNFSDASSGLDKDIISIVCFLVSHKYRRLGISGLLLQEIKNYYRSSDNRFIEAYPFKNAVKDSENYHGPLQVYLKNGFYIDKEYDKYSVVRYNLSGSDA